MNLGHNYLLDAAYGGRERRTRAMMTLRAERQPRPVNPIIRVRVFAALLVAVAVWAMA
jgi:hypothetical protein